MPLDGSGLPAAACVAWPYLLTCSQANLRVYDLTDGSLVQALSLPSATRAEIKRHQEAAEEAAEAAAEEESAASAGGAPHGGLLPHGGMSHSPAAPVVHLTACGPHLVVLGIGRSLLMLPPEAGSWIEREVTGRTSLCSLAF